MSVTISLFQPILSGIFVTISTVKVTLMPDFYTWDFLLINQSEEIGDKKQLQFLAQEGPN